MSEDDEVMWLHSLTGDDLQGVHVDAWKEAKAEIARLRAENAVLRELLRPFAKEGNAWLYQGSINTFSDDFVPVLYPGGSCENCGSDPGTENANFTVGDLRRAALSENEDFMCQADDNEQL